MDVSADQFNNNGYYLIGTPGAYRVVSNGNQAAGVSGGSQDIDQNFANDLVNKGVKVYNTTPPADLPITTKAQDWIQQNTPFGSALYTSKLGTLTPDQFSTEVSNIQTTQQGQQKNSGTSGFSTTPINSLPYNPKTGVGSASLPGSPGVTSIANPVVAPKITSGNTGSIPLSTPNAPSVLNSIANGANTTIASGKTNLENTYNTQITDYKNQEDALKTTIANSQGKLSDTELSNYRDQLQKTERARLDVEDNFFANQKSIAELEQIMTDANQEVKNAQDATGLASIKNPTIALIKADAAARVGVIQAVMAARNNQISVAQSLIDKTLSAISADKQDQIDYYTSIKDAANKDLVTLQAKEKELIDANVNSLKNQLQSQQDSADYIKKLMLDPKNAQFVEDAGVKVGDPLEVINQKMAKQAAIQDRRDKINEFASKGYQQVTAAQISNKPANEIVKAVDSSGEPIYFWNPPAPKSTDTVSIDQKRQMAGLADAKLREVLDSKTGFTNGADYMQLRSDWAQYLPVTDFDSQFGHLLSDEDKKKFGIK